MSFGLTLSQARGMGVYSLKTHRSGLHNKYYGSMVTTP